MRSSDGDYSPIHTAPGLKGIGTGVGPARTETKQDHEPPIEELLAKAWGYVGEGLFEPAFEAFSNALELAPESKKEALYGQALCLRKLGKKEEARGKLEDLSEIERNYTGFLVKEALLYIDKKEYDTAIEPFVEANGILGEVRDAFLKMIGSLHSRIPFDEVETFIKSALKYLPGNPGIRSEYGWLHYYAEQYEEAIEKFDEVLSDKTNLDLKASKYLGYESAIQGKVASLRLLRQFQKAYEQLKDLIQVLPGNKGIQSELGWLYFDLKQYDSARKIFEGVYENGERSALQWIISCRRSQRDYKEAENWLRKAFQELKEDDPIRIGIQNERGWLFFDQKRYAEALIAFDEALKFDEHHEFALQGKVASLRLERQFQDAEELLKIALNWHPTSIGILSERGWLFFDQKKYSEADNAFAKAVKLAPNRVDLKFSRVEVLNRMNRSFEAEKILQALKRRFPDDVEVMERLGRFYIHQRDLKSAKEEFRSILKKDPANISGLGGLGAVYVTQARYEDAISCFRKIIQLDKYNPAWYANLAWALTRQESRTSYRQGPREALEPIRKRLGMQTRDYAALSPLAEAEVQCEKALSFDSESAEAYGCLGTIAFKRGQLISSEDYLLTSIRKDPQKGNYVGLGALYVQMGRYDDAEKVLKEALRNQDDVPAHVELGNLYLKTGKTKEAIQEFRQAKAIDPNDDDPPRALAIALMQVNEFNEADAVLRDGLRRLDESKRWRLHLTRSQLLTKNGDETEYSHYYNEAYKEAKRAIRLKPDHPDPYFQAGFIRAKLKDYKGAHKYFRSCLRQDKQHDEAESNLIYVRSLIREERERSRSSFWAGFCVGSLAVSQLILLWYFFKQGRVTETILSVLLPILLGLVVVAFLIPVLYKLKLPGLEAELRERKETVSSGSKGEIVFSSSPPTISSGPR